MNIHWLQHVDFEGLGCIDPWLAENGHTVSCTREAVGRIAETTLFNIEQFEKGDELTNRVSAS